MGNDLVSRRRAFVTALYVGILLGGVVAGDWIARSFQISIHQPPEGLADAVALAALAVYVVLTTLPFVPGIEIGLGLIVVCGPYIVPFVYLATVISLTASYAIGRLFPDRWLAAIFRNLALFRAERMVTALASMNTEERLAHLTGCAPKRWVPVLLRHRFWTLAVLLNLPGSTLIGGGGGICMTVGLSRLIPFPQFLLTVALAVSPVPLVILVSSAWGQSLLGWN